MLASLFSVELWERFSFYGMQGIIMLYMYYQTTDGGLGMDQSVAAGIVGAYGGTVYLCTILGAWIADRLIGSERAMFANAVLIMAGHVALSVLPGYAGLATGLLLIAVGSGGLKANITNLVGPLLTGWVQQQWGFHVGFALAAIGMAVGLTQYVVSRRRLPRDVHQIPTRCHAPTTHSGSSLRWWPWLRLWWRCCWAGCTRATLPM